MHGLPTCPQSISRKHVIGHNGDGKYFWGLIIVWPTQSHCPFGTQVFNSCAGGGNKNIKRVMWYWHWTLYLACTQNHELAPDIATWIIKADRKKVTRRPGTTPTSLHWWANMTQQCRITFFGKSIFTYNHNLFSQLLLRLSVRYVISTSCAEMNFCWLFFLNQSTFLISQQGLLWFCPVVQATHQTSSIKHQIQDHPLSGTATTAFHINFLHLPLKYAIFSLQVCYSSCKFTVCPSWSSV